MKKLNDKTIKIENISSQGHLVVSDMNLWVKPGELLALVGRVGSGKSSLLHAMMQQIYIVKGSSNYMGSIAYISQSPFLINDTLRENVLFGCVYDSKKYVRVLKMCELIDDLKILPAGDMTQIGERGINLSGG
jgi:ABC-type multidrug transport system fused ATPase/permease subunit